MAIVEMTDKKIEKVKIVKAYLDKKGIFYTEGNYGQFTIDTMNIWATTEKYYDTKTGVKGKGINACFKYLEGKEVL